MDLRDLIDGIVSDSEAETAQAAAGMRKIGFFAAHAYRGAVDGGAPEQLAVELARQVIDGALRRRME